MFDLQKLLLLISPPGGTRWSWSNSRKCRGLQPWPSIWAHRLPTWAGC